jgi:hypothetical protein
MIAYLDINANYGAHAPSSEEVLEDCKGDIKSMMKPYVATFSGTTATITPPKNSLEGKAGEQLELEL